MRGGLQRRIVRREQDRIEDVEEGERGKETRGRDQGKIDEEEKGRGGKWDAASDGKPGTGKGEKVV